jgi:hypothetical protein
MEYVMIEKKLILNFKALVCVIYLQEWLYALPEDTIPIIVQAIVEGQHRQQQLYLQLQRLLLNQAFVLYYMIQFVDRMGISIVMIVSQHRLALIIFVDSLLIWEILNANVIKIKTARNLGF